MYVKTNDCRMTSLLRLRLKNLELFSEIFLYSDNSATSKIEFILCHYKGHIQKVTLISNFNLD